MTNWDDERVREYHRERHRRIKKERPEYSLFVGARSRARLNDIPFDIEESDVIIPEFCPILGIRLEVADTKRTDNSPSLDKIDPNLGYVKGNIQVISWRANNLKRDATRDELHAFAKYFYENHMSERDF